MSAKSKFSASEWELVKDAPYWVQTAITAEEGRMGLLEKRAEAKALREFLDSHRPSSEVAKAVLADHTGEHNVKIDSSSEEVAAKLSQISKIVSGKVSEEEADDFSDFLLETGKVVVEAYGENLLRRDQVVNDAEEEAMASVARALKATAEDRRQRAEAAAAERRAEFEARQKEAQAAREEKAAKEAAEKRAQEARERYEKAKKAAEERAAAAKREKERAAAREARMAKFREQAAAQRAKREAAAAEVIHEVVAGDTLSHIALHYYGSAVRWKEIYEANKDQIDNPSLIRPGQKLRIPDAG